MRIRDFLKKRDLNPVTILLLSGIGIFFIAFFIYPLIYVLVNAFYVEGRFTLAFIWLVITKPGQWQVVLNSINLAITVTILTSIVSLPIAFLMTRFNFPGKKFFSGLLLVPMVLPPFVGAVGMRQIFARFGSINLLLMKFGLIDTPIDWLGGGLLGVVLMEVLHLYPFMYLNIMAALSNIDPSMEEAAHNVGASGWTVFKKITFPLMLPGVFAGASIVFIWALTDLGTPLVFEYRQLIPVQIFNMLGDVHENPAGYVLVLLMIMLSASFFYVSKRSFGNTRYEMMGRGHAVATPVNASFSVSLLTYVLLLVVIISALLPHISVILTSISDRWFMTILPETYTTKYYPMVFGHPITTTSIRNSLLLSGSSTVVDVIAGIGIAYLLARTRIPGKNLLDSVSMLPLAVPGIIIAFGYVAGFSGTILDPRVNPMVLLIFGYAIRRLPYMVRSAYAGFQQTSVTLEEAAQNVGANKITTLKRITLPLIFANLIAGCILCFAFAMLEVSDSLILAMEEKYYPITKAIYTLLARPDGAYIASALGVLGMLLLAISLFFTSRVLGKKLGSLFRI